MARKTKPDAGAAEPPAKTAPAARSAFEKLLVEISTRFITLPADQVDSEILLAQRQVCESLGIDISALWQKDLEYPGSLTTTHIYVPPDFGLPTPSMNAEDTFPWSMKKLFDGEIIILNRMEDLPVEAGRDLELYRHFRMKSSLTFPLSAGGGPVFGALSFNTFRKERVWSAEIIDELRLVAQVFANALARKRSDQALRESETRFRGIFQESIEGLYRTSPEGRILMANPALARILGYDSVDEAIRSISHVGQQVWARPEERDEFIGRLREHGTVQAHECLFKRKNGDEIWVSLSSRPVLGPEGRIAYFDGSVEDISERKGAEIALAESELRYRTLFESAPAGIILIGLDGRVRAANSLQARLYGYDSAQQLIGFYAPAFVAERDRERAGRNMLELLQGHEMAERVYSCVRRDGSEFIAQVTSQVVRDSRQEIQGYLCLTSDITQLKRDEAERTQLRHERTHLARVLTVDEISSSLAHEINQPLGAILNNAEAVRILLSKASGEPEVLSEIIEDIIRDAKRAGDVVRKVRRVMKKGDVQFERLSVNRLIDETLEILRNNLALNNVTLRLELAPDLSDIRGDRVRLQQVLLNLAANALDAMQGTPSRVLKIRTATDGPDLISISVGDSGPGLPENGREILFQPYYTTKKAGLGLGLAICRSIVEEHGGRIRADNAPGEGAVFSLSLKTWQEGSA